MKIGDEVYVHGYVDEIRNDVVIIRNEGGYFGTVPSEITADRKTEPTGYNLSPVDKDINVRSKDEPQTEVWITAEEYAKCQAEADKQRRELPKLQLYDDDGNYIESQTDCVGVPMAFIDDEKFKAHCLNCQRDASEIECLDCDGDRYFLPDEPQTDCAWGKDQ